MQRTNRTFDDAHESSVEEYSAVVALTCSNRHLVAIVIEEKAIMRERDELTVGLKSTSKRRCKVSFSKIPIRSD